MDNLIKPSNRITWSYVDHRDTPGHPNGEDNGHDRGYTLEGDLFKAPCDGVVVSQSMSGGSKPTYLAYIHYTHPNGYKFSSRLCHTKVTKTSFKAGEEVFQAVDDYWVDGKQWHTHGEYYHGGHFTPEYMQANRENESAIRSIRTIDRYIGEYESAPSTPTTPAAPSTVSYTQAYDANKTKTWQSVTYWGDSSPLSIPTSNISNDTLTKDWDGWLKGTKFRNVSTSTPESTTYTPTKYYLGGWNDIKAKYGSTDTFKISIMKEETNTSKYGSGVYTFKSSASASDRKGWDSNQRFKK